MESQDAVLLHTVTGVPVIQCLGYDTWNKKKGTTHTSTRRSDKNMD